MSGQDDFDELARQKLDELRFPVDEAHWRDAQRAIQGERRRRRAWMFLGAAVLLLPILLLWWPAPADGPHAEVVAPEKTAPPAPALATDPASQTDEAPVHAQEHRSEKPSTTTTGAASSALQEEDHRPATVPERALPHTTERRERPAHTNTPRTRTSPTDAGVTITATSVPARRSSEASSDSDDQAARRPDPTASPSGEPRRPDERPTAPPDAPSVGPSAPMTDNGSERPTTGTATTLPTVAPITDTAVALDASPAEHATSITIGATSATKADTAMLTILTDSARTTVVRDSIPANAPSPIALPVPLPRAPWELTVWGGMFSTDNAYTGPQSDEWNAASSSATAPAFGVEAMRLSSHFGIGTGLHHITYAERFDADAAYLLAGNWRRVFTLDAVDTAIFLVTDTLDIGGEAHYTGINYDTTVYVLASHYVENITRTQVREARSFVNRVSYLEVPLLLDAHTAHGRWSFGIVGGPTVGLLSGRRGTLPRRTPDGYVDLVDEPFRSVMFGYTARIYARFRVGDRWSLGAEPSVRGQLRSAFDGTDGTRRSQAVGMQLGLTYRLGIR